jgi:hypothetical protein
VAASLSAYGHGIHIAANAAQNLMNPGQIYTESLNDATKLVYFMDESLSHHMIFGGFYFNYVFLIWADSREILGRLKKTDILRISFFEYLILYTFALVNGVLAFGSFVEGQTVQMSLVFSGLMTLHWLFRKIFGKKRIGFVSSYFYVTTAVAFSCLVAYGYATKWAFPEFSRLGLGSFSSWIPQAMEKLNESAPFIVDNVKQILADLPALVQKLTEQVTETISKITNLS